MTVLLLIPTVGYGRVYPAFLSNSDFPVGFAYVAAALKAAGHRVVGLNANNDPGYGSAYRMLAAKLTVALRAHQPDVVCLGGLCTDYLFIRDAMRIVRKAMPDVPVVCGGGIITNDAPFVMELLRPDFCVSGEGEEVLVRLLAAIRDDPAGVARVPNVGYWQDGKAHFTDTCFDYGDLDARSFPDYEPFGIDEMLDRYGLATRNDYRFTRLYPRVMTLVTARSCPFSCTFCVHQRGPAYRARSIANVMKEVEALYERYHFNVLLVVDELFAVNQARFREFCTVLQDRKKEHCWDFDWSCQTHLSAALSASDLALAKASGCYFIGYGLESASSRVLASMRKRTSPAQMLTTMDEAHTARIAFSGNFIFGDVAETPETIAETLGFFSKHCLTDIVYLTHMRPYPGSAIYDGCVANRIVTDRRRFYERIDKVLYNMTTMPDALWLPWLSRLIETAEAMPWLQCTNASVCREDARSESDPIARYLHKRVFLVDVTCPFCRQACCFREVLGVIGMPEGLPVIACCMRLARKVMEVCRREGTRLPAYVLWFARHRLSRWFPKPLPAELPMTRLLVDLWHGNPVREQSFVTSCPHCKRRFRVVVPSRCAEGLPDG